MNVTRVQTRANSKRRRSSAGCPCTPPQQKKSRLGSVCKSVDKLDKASPPTTAIEARSTDVIQEQVLKDGVLVFDPSQKQDEIKVDADVSENLLLEDNSQSVVTPWEKPTTSSALPPAPVAPKQSSQDQKLPDKYRKLMDVLEVLHIFIQSKRSYQGELTWSWFREAQTYIEKQTARKCTLGMFQQIKTLLGDELLWSYGKRDGGQQLRFRLNLNNKLARREPQQSTGSVRKALMPQLLRQQRQRVQKKLLNLVQEFKQKLVIGKSSCNVDAKKEQADRNVERSNSDDFDEETVFKCVQSQQDGGQSTQFDNAVGEKGKKRQQKDEDLENERILQSSRTPERLDENVENIDSSSKRKLSLGNEHLYQSMSVKYDTDHKADNQQQYNPTSSVSELTKEKENHSSNNQQSQIDTIDFPDIEKCPLPRKQSLEPTTILQTPKSAPSYNMLNTPTTQDRRMSLDSSVQGRRLSFADSVHLKQQLSPSEQRIIDDKVQKFIRRISFGGNEDQVDKETIQSFEANEIQSFWNSRKSVELGSTSGRKSRAKLSDFMLVRTFDQIRTEFAKGPRVRKFADIVQQLIVAIGDSYSVDEIEGLIVQLSERAPEFISVQTDTNDIKLLSVNRKCDASAVRKKLMKVEKQNNMLTPISEQ